MARRMRAIGFVVAAVAAAIVPSRPAAADSTDQYWHYTNQTVTPTYTPVVGEFADDDGANDIFWYSSSGTSSLWIGHPGRTFTKVSLDAPHGAQVVAGDFSGDSYTDLLFYKPGSGSEVLWTSVDGSEPFEVSAAPVTVNGSYQPLVLDDYRSGSLADQKDQILWYAPGSTPDPLWRFAADGSGAHTTATQSVNGTFKPVIGDFDGDRLRDVVWYAPGSAADSSWRNNANGTFTKTSLSVSGTYQAVSIFNPTRDSILWYAPGGANDSYWRKLRTATPIDQVGLGGTAVAIGLNTALIYDPYGVDAQFVGAPTRGSFYNLREPNRDIGAGFKPFPCDCDGDGYLDVFWYAPGSKADSLWYTNAGSGDARRLGGTRARPSGATLR